MGIICEAVSAGVHVALVFLMLLRQLACPCKTHANLAFAVLHISPSSLPMSACFYSAGITQITFVHCALQVHCASMPTNF